MTASKEQIRTYLRDICPVDDKKNHSKCPIQGCVLTAEEDDTYRDNSLSMSLIATEGVKRCIQEHIIEEECSIDESRFNKFIAHRALVMQVMGGESNE